MILFLEKKNQRAIKRYIIAQILGGVFMRKKKISELNIENIDEVIYSISDKMLEKYTAAVRRLYSDGN